MHIVYIQEKLWLNRSALVFWIIGLHWCPTGEVSPGATLGNLLVIRALMKASTIPATVKKLFLSLAFSDLAVGLLPQLMTAIMSAVMLKMASSGDDLAFFCPTVLTVLLYFMYLLAVASFLNVTVIAFDRVLVFRSTCDIRSLSRPNVLQWCWCLYG